MIDIYEVVTKLIGPVQPVGETHEDVKRLENMKALTGLVDRLLTDIDRASADADRQEGSMRAIGKHAQEFMRSWQNTL